MLHFRTMWPADAIYRFGAFELDCAEGQLRKRGVRLRVQEQSLQILIRLVRRPGRLVTRREIREALWPPGTYVDSDNAINSAIWKLRESLGDPAGQPKFIETLSRKGYRFIADVQTFPSVTGSVEESLSAGSRPDTTGEVSKTNAVTRIIVLPFRVLPKDEETEFLAHTLPDALSGSLLAIDSLIVRSTAMALSGAFKSMDYREIGAAADVDVIIMGSLMRTDERLILTCQLVDAHSGTLIWSDTVSAPSHHLFQLQEGLANHIAESLKLSLTDRERYNLTRDIPRSNKAYEFYLRANQSGMDRNLQNIRTARDLYLQCLQEDSNFAPAWAQFGRVCRFIWKFGEEPAETADLANKAFQRAFALNPELALAHNLYTSVECDEGQSLKAMLRLLGRARFRRNDPDLFAGLVQACRYCGELEASLAAHACAVRLQSNILTSVPMTYFLMSEYQRALNTIGPRESYYLDCAALAAMGDREAALERLRRRERVGGATGVVGAIMCSLRAYLEGNSADCIRFIHEGEIMTSRDPESLFFSARHLARVNECERALAVLNSALDAGFLFTRALNADPWLKPLHSTRGYGEIVEKAQRNQLKAHSAFLHSGGDQILAKQNIAGEKPAWDDRLHP